MQVSETEEDWWISNLTKYGVNVEVHDSKKRGKYYTYELMDTSKFPDGKKIPANLKSRSYKLGTRYDVNVEVHDSKKRGKYYTYELMDTSKFPDGKKIPANLKSRSYKLGTRYDAEEIESYFLKKEQELQKLKVPRWEKDSSKFEIKVL